MAPKSQCQWPIALEIRGEQVGAVGMYVEGYREGHGQETNCAVVTKETGLERKIAGSPPKLLNYLSI